MSEKLKSKASRIWINNSAGQPSMSATFAAVAFFTTTLIYILSSVDKIGSFTMRHFDPGICAAYMMPVLGLYFSRRYTDAKFGSQTTAPVASSKPAAPSGEEH